MTNKEIIKLLKEYRNYLLKIKSSLYIDEESRDFLNKNCFAVQKVLIKAGTLRYLDVAPPAITGGYLLRNVNPFDLLFDPPYGLDIYGYLSDVIMQAIGIIEQEPGFSDKLESIKSEKIYSDIWSLIHPSISEVSSNRIKDGYYADAVEAACKALNSSVKNIVLDNTSEELDGANLMRKAFSPEHPIICVAPLSSKTGKDTQRGYMDIFAGVMSGIRNPKAHEIEIISIDDALRILVFLSHLMFIIDQRIITE